MSLFVRGLQQTLSLASKSSLQLQRLCSFSAPNNFINGPIGTSVGQRYFQPLLTITPPTTTPSRTVTKFSLKTGKRKNVGAVLKRFFRLDNGLWIRRFGGHSKRIYKKSEYERFKMQQHVVCTKMQCMMLDQMVTDNIKKKKYYIDDPFEPYHKRNNFDYFLPKRKA